jgi:tetratricopeptide (TPR) repeat protein
VKKITKPDHHLLSLLYFYYTRLCQEECRSQDALDAVQRSRYHLDKAAETDPELHDSTLYIRILSNQGVTHLAMERYAESERFHTEAIEHCIRLAKEEQCSLGNLRQNLGSCYLWAGDLAKAEVTLKQSLSEYNKNPEGAKYTMGNLLLRLNRYDEALAFHKDVLQIYADALGPEHLTTADSWHKIGCIFSMPEFPGGNLKEAEYVLPIKGPAQVWRYSPTCAEKLTLHFIGDVLPRRSISHSNQPTRGIPFQAYLLLGLSGGCRWL